MTKLYLLGVMMLGFISIGTVEVKAQCRVKDMIMGDVQDENMQDESSTKVEPSKKNDQPVYTTNTLSIYYNDAVGKKPLLKAIKKNKCELTKEYEELKRVAIKIPKTKTIEEMMVIFRKIKGVTVVNRDTI